jgi:hypothetical protein
MDWIMSRIQLDLFGLTFNTSLIATLIANGYSQGGVSLTGSKIKDELEAGNWTFVENAAAMTDEDIFTLAGEKKTKLSNLEKRVKAVEDKDKK